MFSRPPFAISLPAAVRGAIGCAMACAGTISAQSLEQRFEPELYRFVAAHCLECHGELATKGDLDLRAWSTAAGTSADLEVLSLVRQRVEAGEMPPRDRSRPGMAELQAALHWIEEALRSARAADPGRVSMRRLTRREWRHSIEDLFGIAIDVEERLPVDAVGAGFDTIGDLQLISPMLFEKYLELAEEISALAVPSTAAIAVDVGVADLEGGEEQNFGNRAVRGLYSAGEFRCFVELPRAGSYRLSFEGSGDQAGDEPPRLEIGTAEQVLGSIEFTAKRGKFETQRLEAQLGAGRVPIAASFVNDFYMPEEGKRKAVDRNVYLSAIRIEGPLDPPPRSVFQMREVDPVLEDAQGKTRNKLSTIANALLERAWRRPIEASDLKRVLKLSAGEEDLEARLRTVIVAALISPRFLYRMEMPASSVPSGAAHEAHPLDAYDLATRLSYFLWSSIPDDALRGAAASGALASDAGLLFQTRRLLRDVRASALIEGFASQWLQLARLDELVPDTAIFPAFDAALRHSMRTESELFFEALLREDRPLEELVAANFSFVDERLAQHYGLSGIEGKGFRRVAFASDRRGGVLGQAAILTLTSNPARTSPVKRGKWILDVLLDAPPPPPPPEAGALEENGPAAALPLRERLERHRRDPSCATCHVRMDALGFALEAYGPTGERRTADGAGAIDASGELPDGRRIEDLAGLRAVLLEGNALPRAVLKALFVYALGREFEAYDEPWLARSLAELEVRRERGEELSLRDLIETIVVSDAFRMRRDVAVSGEERR